MGDDLRRNSVTPVAHGATKQNKRYQTNPDI
jgi:hypothetical protein